MAFQLQYSSELNLEGAVHMPTCMQQRGDGIVGLLYKAGCPFCRRNVALQGRHYSMASTAGMHQQLCRCPARAACQPCVRAGSFAPHTSRLPAVPNLHYPRAVEIRSSTEGLGVLAHNSVVYDDDNDAG